MDKYLFGFITLCGVCFIWPAESQMNLANDEMNWRLSEMKNVTDLCNFMGKEDCQKLIDSVNFEDQLGDKVAVSGRGPQVAKFDACNPRMMTIAIPRHPDPEIIIWPPCTRAKRCGGCCTSDVFSCEPTKTVDTYVKVFDTKLAYPGAQRFTFVGIRNVRIVEHEHCDAQCKTKPHECHKYQVYRYRKCRCECRPERMKLKATCHKNQRWDDSECDCVCPNRATVNCPPPFRFSTTTCKCTIKTEVNGEIDLDDVMSQIDIDMLNKNKMLDNRDTVNFATLFGLTGGISVKDNMVDNGNIINDEAVSIDVEGVSDTPMEESTVTTTEATTTTSTEPPTTSTTTEAPTTTTQKATTTTKKPKPSCAIIMKNRCKGGWRAKRLTNGKCMCLPPIRISGRRPPLRQRLKKLKPIPRQRFPPRG